MHASDHLDPETLEGFRRAQRLAYDCAETIAAEMTPGMRERDVAARMQDYLDDNGAEDCFHRPFAWFGDRTAFRGLIGVSQLGGFNPAFYPGNRRLEADMPFILDCAPTVHGYTADIGYCGVIGTNRILDKLMDDLAEYRQLILEQVRARRPRRLESHMEQLGGVGAPADAGAMGGRTAPGLPRCRRQVRRAAGGHRGRRLLARRGRAARPPLAGARAVADRTAGGLT